MPALPVVIVAHRKRELLRRCLASLYTHAGELALDVWVVDNCSHDGTTEMVRACFPQVHLIENVAPRGFGANNNHVLRQLLVQGRDGYVLLLNDDTEVLPGALQTLCRFLDAHPRAGAVGCRLLFPDGSLQRSTQAEPTLLREAVRAQPLLRRLTASPLFHRLARRLLRRLFPKATEAFWDHDRVRAVPSVMAACVLVRLAALRQVGLFDEQFVMYFEDCDLFSRMRRAGWEIMFTPQASVIHHLGASTGQRQHRRVANQMLVEWYRSLLYFCAKHYSPAYTLAMRAAVAANFALLLPYEAVRLLFIPRAAPDAARALRVYTAIVRLALRPAPLPPP